jgi:hypothetical protein
MDSSVKTPLDQLAEAGAVACPLTTPLLGRIPGVLAVATIPVSLFFNPLFFNLAGGLLAMISLLMSPPRGRMPGVAGLIGSVLLGVARLHY